MNSESHSSHLQTLYSITEMLRKVETDRLEIEALLPLVLRAISVELNGDYAGIVLVDDASLPLAFWTFENDLLSYHKPDAYLQKVLREGAVAYAIRTNSACLIENTLDDDLWLPIEEHPSAVEPWSVICAPLTVGQRPIGVITIAKVGKVQFTRDDYNLIAAIGRQTGITIDNARLFQMIEHKLTESEQFNTITRRLNKLHTLDDVVSEMLIQLENLIDAESAAIALCEQNELVYQYATGLHARKIKGFRLQQDDGVAGWVVRTGQPALVNKIAEDARFSQLADARTGACTSATICVPLLVNSLVIGVIQMINPASEQFSGADLALLTRFVDVAAGAFGRATLFTQMHRAEALYSGLLKDSITPILITDHAGVIQLVNDSAATLMQYPIDAMMGQSIDMLHKTPLVEKVQAAMTERQQSVEMIETEVVAADETLIPVELHIKHTHQGAMQWMYRDISHQLLVQEMRDDLTMMLLHDLKNPLSNILNSLEMLQLELPDTEDSTAATIHDIATRSSYWLHNLVHSLLDINRLEVGNPITARDVVSVPSLLVVVSDVMSARLMMRNVRLQNDIEPDLPEAFVNKDMIERVVLNLTDNALKFSQRDDTITLSAETTDDNMLKIMVSDQGPGVQPAYRQSIFEKYYQSPDTRAAGMGLGLAFCALTIEAHGGRIWVDEATGGGARFNLTLPIATVPSDPS